MALVMNAGGTIFNEAANGIGFTGDPGTKPLYLWKEMIADGTMHILLVRTTILLRLAEMHLQAVLLL